jgi:hypothetical protein
VSGKLGEKYEPDSRSLWDEEKDIDAFGAFSLKK